MGQKKKRIEGYNFGNASSISGTGGGSNSAGATSLALEQDIMAGQDAEGQRIGQSMPASLRLANASRGTLSQSIDNQRIKNPPKPPAKQPPAKPPVKKKEKK